MTQRNRRTVLGWAVAGALTLAAALPAPQATHGSRGAVITYYPYPGTTYYNTWTTEGRTAACSWDIPAFATVYVNGDPYICEDRGGGLGYGNPSWVDIFAYTAWPIARYGDWATIEVLP